MANTFTTNYTLTKSEIGANNDNWGNDLNTALDTVDTQIVRKLDKADLVDQTSSNISFSSSDEIQSSTTNLFQNYRAGDKIRISGASSGGNNALHTITSKTNGQTLVVATTLTQESAGATITYRLVPHIDEVDIDGGTINGATIAESDVTVGNGKTLNVSAGTLTLATGQIARAAIADDAINADKIDAGAVGTAALANDGVTYAKMQDIATANRVLGRASAGEISEVQVATDMIANDAITYAKMQDTATNNRVLGAATAGTVAEVQVATDMVVNDAITYAKMQDTAAGNVLLGTNDANGAAIEELTKSDVLTMLNVADGANAYSLPTASGVTKGGAKIGSGLTMTGEVLSADALSDGAVTTAKLADTAVTTAKITDANITTAKLAANAVTTAKITDANVTTAKLAANAVTTAKITDANVTTAKIADDAVTAAKIPDDTIDSEHYAAASIDNEHLADDAVGVAELSATGTASSSTYLRGDNTWSTPPDTDTNTTYSAGTDLDLSGTTFSLESDIASTVNGVRIEHTDDENLQISNKDISFNSTHDENLVVGVYSSASIYPDLSASGSSDNTVLGCEAGRKLGSSAYSKENTLVGSNAGRNQTAGSGNILIGHYAASSSTYPGGNITTGSYNLVLGTTAIQNAHVQVDWTINSDERDKTEITDFSHGLNFIKTLRPVTYKWDKRVNYLTEEQKYDPDFDISSIVRDGTHKESQLEVGLIAQEVIDSEKKIGYCTGSDTDLFANIKTGDENYGLRYGRLVVPLINAVKELSAQVEALTAKVEALEG